MCSQQHKFFFSSKEETFSYFKKLSMSFHSRQVVFLEGELGSGKTQVVRWWTSQAVSPTYALHQSYTLKASLTGHTYVDHFDLYRLKSAEDLESIGFWDSFNKPKGLILVEWPDLVLMDSLPNSWSLLRIHLQSVHPAGSLSTQNEARHVNIQFYAALEDKDV